MTNQSVIGLLMIASGLALISGGAAVLARKQPEPGAPHPQPHPQPPEVGATALPAPAPIPIRPPALVPDPTSEEKGRRFEDWAVRRFQARRQYFAIKDRRGDRKVDGALPESSTWPDLEVEFRLRGRGSPFAVECKWRRRFEPGDREPWIEWASEDQIVRYRRFQEARSIPVFAMIGIGGEPDDPAELYIVPLDRSRYPRATADYLSRFRKDDPKGSIYYEPGERSLR